jgi:hypothetical protein
MSTHVPVDRQLDQNPCTLRAAAVAFGYGCPLIPAYAGLKPYQLQLSFSCASEVTATSLWDLLAPVLDAHEFAETTGTVQKRGLRLSLLAPAEASVVSST